MEETLIQANEEEGASALTGRGTSIFAGSTRWMAPELVMALVEDNEEDSRGPQITLMSDVYAFSSVCLEVMFFALILRCFANMALDGY